MVTSTIADSISGDGQQIAAPGDPTDISGFLDQQTEHSVARVFTAVATTFPTHVYTNTVKAHYIDMSKKKSTCSVTIQDESLVNIDEYESNYGVSLNTNIDGYDYLIVVAEDNKAGITTAGNYAADKIVLFSGYNRGTYAMDLDDLNVTCNYVGIEEMLNEIKIDGILEVDGVSQTADILSGDVIVNQTAYYDRRVVFNEKGRRDKFDGQLKTTFTYSDLAGSSVSEKEETVPIFDKTGLGYSYHWTCLDIFDYLMALYHKKSQDIRNYLDQADRLDFVSQFLRFDFGSITRSDLADVIPKDFDISGMGVLDAIYKVIDESRRYSVTKRYVQDGVAMVGMRANSKTQRQADSAGDIPLKMPIGEYGAAAVKADIVESANINLNRENKSVGRVVVRGQHLRINTLATTWGPNTVTPIASTNKSTKVQAANSSDFSYHMHLLSMDYSEAKTGVPQQSYVIMNTAMVGDMLGAATGISIADFNEATDQELFKNERIMSFEDKIALPYGNSNSREADPMQIYTAAPYKNEAVTPETTHAITTGSNGTDTFYYIEPIVGGKEADLKIAAKYKTGDYGEFQLYSNADKKDDGRTTHRFKEYIDDSQVPAAAKYPKSRGVDTNEIPLYIRCSIKTDYRIRGIAEIAGYDTAKHRTIYIDDKGAPEISVGYRDFEYDGAGGWSAVTSGYLDGVGTAEQQVLDDLQSKAAAILDEQTIVGNSGYIEVSGCQYSIKPGDMVDEFTGTGRAFDFEGIINKVGFDLRERRTILSMGVNRGQ